MQLVVKNEALRIDKYLAMQPDLTFSREFIRKLINNHNILVNNKPVKNSYQLKTGDVITIDEN